MKSYAFEVRGTVKATSGEWPVGVHIVLEAETLAALRGSLDSAIDGLHKMGLRPPNSRPLVGVPTTGRPAMEAPEPNVPIPYCEIHREGMSRSKHQRKAGTVSFYCPQKNEDGSYCDQRAGVDIKTGLPDFFTARGK